METIKVNKSNFSDFVNKYVENGIFHNLELPKNENDFKEFTNNVYGIELGVNCIAYPYNGKEYECEYKITGITEYEYSKNSIYKLWDKKFSQYEGLRVLLNSVFGELYCGGVSTYHYGQCRCTKEQWEVVLNWDKNNESKYVEKLIEQHNQFCEIFGRNPFLK